MPRMGAGALLEPVAVIVLLFGGAWINRASDYSLSVRENRPDEPLPVSRAVETNEDLDIEDAQLTHSKRSLSPSLLPSQEDTWREREIRLLEYHKVVASPNTAVFRNRLLSRLLHKFPFLVEAWYWALIYWVRGDALWRSLSKLTIFLTGIPTRPSIHSGDLSRRHCTCCPSTCPASH